MKRKLKSFSKSDPLKQGSMFMADFSWGSGKCPTYLYAPYEVKQKGHWTYPKAGYIQWKND